MSNRLIEVIQTSSGEGAYEKAFDAPAVETVAARLEQLGCFRDDSIGANQSAAAMQLGSVDAASPTNVIAPMSGTVVGMVVQAIDTGTSGAITAGSMTAQLTVGGTAVTSQTSVLDSTHLTRVTIFTTPTAFSAKDALGINLASASLAPTTSRCHAWLLIRWDGVELASA